MSKSYTYTPEIIQHNDFQNLMHQKQKFIKNILKNENNKYSKQFKLINKLIKRNYKYIQQLKDKRNNK